MYVRKPDSTIVREIDEDKTFVLNINTGDSYIYDGVSNIFLNVLDGSVQNTNELVKQLYLLFEDISYEELFKDFVEFIEDLAEKNLVVINKDHGALEEYVLESLHIEITMRCNERCIHCYLPDKLKDECSIISFDDFCVIINQFIQLGGKRVSISGGEPFTHPDIVKILEYCDNKNLAIHIQTNLTLLTEEYLKVLKSLKNIRIEVSIYSLSFSIHDKITNVKGSLSKTLKNMQNLLENNIPVQIGCPIMVTNYKSIPDLICFSKKNNIHIRCNPLLLNKTDGDKTSVEKEQLSLAQFKELYDALKQKDEDYVREFVLETYDCEKELLDNPKSFLNKHLCTAGIDSCSISTDGNVYPCAEWHNFILGNIHNCTLKDIWFQSPNLYVLRSINHQRCRKKCLECNAIDFCKRCMMIVSQRCHSNPLGHDFRTCAEAKILKDLFS